MLAISECTKHPNIRTVAPGAGADDLAELQLALLAPVLVQCRGLRQVLITELPPQVPPIPTLRMHVHVDNCSGYTVGMKRDSTTTIRDTFIEAARSFNWKRKSVNVAG